MAALRSAFGGPVSVDMGTPRRYIAGIMDGIIRILESFHGTDPTPREVGAAADRIAEVGDAAVPSLLEAIQDEDEAVLAVVAASLRRLANPALTQRLLPVLQSPHLGDLAKAILLGVLEDAGMDIHDPALVGAVADLEGLLFSQFPTPPAGPADSQPRNPPGDNGDGAAPVEESR